MLHCPSVNTLSPRQNGRHFADDIFKCIFLNENVWIYIKISLNFVPKGRIDNILALVPIMAWRRRGDKPLSEPMVVSLLTHICVTRPQWVIWMKIIAVWMTVNIRKLPLSYKATINNEWKYKLPSTTLLNYHQRVKYLYHLRLGKYGYYCFNLGLNNRSKSPFISCTSFKSREGQEIGISSIIFPYRSTPPPF